MKAKLAAAGIAVALLIAASASAGDLGWLVRPTAALTEVLSGVPFLRSPGGGYASPERGIAIGRGCAGIRFLTIAFTAGVVATLPRLQRARSQWIALGLVLGSAYVLAIVANASRIVGAILLAELAGGLGEPTASALHLAEGTVVFSTGLLLYALIVPRAIVGSLR